MVCWTHILITNNPLLPLLFQRPDVILDGGESLQESAEDVLVLTVDASASGEGGE